MKVAIHWFRCDYRLHDNAALFAATQKADWVIPIFIFDPVLLKAAQTGAPSVAFMRESLCLLDESIQQSGGKLIFRYGPVETEMREVLKETRAHALYFNRDYEPYARQRDSAVEKLAQSLGVEVHSFKDNVIHEPEELLKTDGSPYRVFTPFSRIWKTLPKGDVFPRAKFRYSCRVKKPKSLPLPSLKQLGFELKVKMYPAGEKAGRKRLQNFVSDALFSYDKGRDIPAKRSTSGLSPHLRFGTVSPRTVMAEAEKVVARHPERRKAVDTFIGELIWRDFYKQILWHYPHVAHSCFKPKYDHLNWENDEGHFAAWCAGRTGCPMVDAGMRQLNTTGWMHNRLRMITATYLTKDLLVSWQWGERYFMQKLYDADLAANNGGWQWSASTGTDAQPYFRIFNPVSQALKFDPEGLYIQQYVPEIETPLYPKPIVNHTTQRMKALALFRHI